MVSQYGAFMLHRSSVAAQTASAGDLAAIVHSMNIEDERIESIIRTHLELTTDQWRVFTHHELTLSAPEALRAGLATDIEEFSPPPQARFVLV